MLLVLRSLVDPSMRLERAVHALLPELLSVLDPKIDSLNREPAKTPYYLVSVGHDGPQSARTHLLYVSFILKLPHNHLAHLWELLPCI